MFDYQLIILIILAIGLPLVAVWVYFDAKKRGKRDNEALKWAAGALFLSVVVVPAWLWTRPNFEAETEFMCPECKEIYEGKKIACPHCGYMLVDDEIVDLSGVEPEDEPEDKPPENLGPEG